MTSKTSLFNKGIYKSTLKRYAWGSVLYFVLLLLTTTLPILLFCDLHNFEYSLYGGSAPESLILSNQYIAIPMMLSMFVPTVAGIMIFRFLHSKKTSVFIHSLPVKRTENFISSVLAGLTLMMAPVFLNSVLLMLLSASQYSALFSVTDCIVWMLLNFFSLFAMFSCVCFVGTLTGNSFAMIALNLLFHFFIFLLSAGFMMIAMVFLHGFNGDSPFINVIAEGIFPIRIGSVMTTWVYENRPLPEDIYAIVTIVVASVVLYVLSGFLYKKRRMETAEDVAGFNCLNHIFKYLVTLMSALGAFAAFSSLMYSSPATVWLLVGILSMLVYFAAEMILKKSFRVWGSYKGYIVFVLVFAAIVSVFAYTDFFGYEKRIPKLESIASATVYEYYSYDEPFVENSKTIEKITEIHKEMIEDREIVSNEKFRGEDTTDIHIKYNLKNGKSLSRKYRIKQEEMREIMNVMYELDAYKMEREIVFAVGDNAEYVEVTNISEKIYEKEKIKELLKCVKSDILNLSYDEIYNDGWSFRLGFTCEREQVSVEEDLYMAPRADIIYDSIEINANYKNTINWIKENGYWESVSLKNEGRMFISSSKYVDFAFEGEDYSQIPEVKNGEIILVEDALEIEKLIDYLHTTGQEYIPYEEAYHICIIDDVSRHNTRIASVSEKEVKKLFRDKISDNFIDKTKP